MSESQNHSDLSEEEEEAYEETEGSADESENDTADDEGLTSGSESDASGTSERNKKEEDAKRKASLLKRKRQQIDKKEKKMKLDKDASSLKKPSKKSKKSSKEKDQSMDSESTKTVLDQPSTSKVEKSDKPANHIAGEDKSTKKEAPDFSDKNVDYNLYEDDPTRLMQKRIKISKDVVVSCRMITVHQPRSNSFEYAAVVFARKGKADKAFEFNLPLDLAPRIISALHLMMKDNSKFFEKNSIKS